MNYPDRYVVLPANVATRKSGVGRMSHCAKITSHNEEGSNMFVLFSPYADSGLVNVNFKFSHGTVETSTPRVARGWC